MLRILSVCTVPTDKSGIPNVIFNLLSHLPTGSVKLGYVSINDPSEYHREVLKSIGAELYVIPRKMSHPIRYIMKLARVSRNYDIIHIHGNSATMVLEMIAAKLGGVRTRIAHAHSTKCTQKIIDRLARPIFYALCNGRMACGVEAGKWLFGNRDFKIVKNGINVDKFRFSLEKRVTIRKRLDLSEETDPLSGNNITIIGHIGNFVEAKNHHYLIKIFDEYHKSHPDSKLLLLGAGPLMNGVKDTVNNLGLNDSVIFAGSVDNPQDYMNAMDVIAMPSLYEGFPLTLIEEQANGLPIVAADTITSDANISGNISYCSISEECLESWKKMLEDGLGSKMSRNERSKMAIIQIRKNGYDMSSVAIALLEYYHTLFN